MNIQNFETTAFALHSIMGTPQSIRKVSVGNTNTDQLVFLSVFVPIMKDSVNLDMIFLNTMVYEKFSLKIDLVSKGIISTLYYITKKNGLCYKLCLQRNSCLVETFIVRILILKIFQKINIFR